MTTTDLALVGRYRLIDRIATGGMGEVWRARDEVLQREVALKLLKVEYADSADFRERFLTEARNAGGLHHPHVVQVHDYGETDEDPPRPFIAMELVEGQPLSALLRQEEPMDPRTAIDLIAQAAAALGAAHAAGIVHRDVKPGNLLVTPDGRVKVTDFGISRAANAVPLTRTGELIGTPHYLSPEQVDGRSATTASDVYALGVILYEALSGRRPFTGDTPLTAALAHLNQPIPDLPESVLPRWAQVVRQALAKDPAERFQDGNALARALREEEEPVAFAAAATLLDDTQPIALRHRRRTTWLAVAALAFVGILVVALLVLTRDEPAPADRSTAVSPSPTTVRVEKSAYLGRDAAAVARQLRELDLRTRITSVANPGDKQAETVVDLLPVGQVRTGTLITISAYSDPPARQAPVGKAPKPTKKQSKASEKPAKANASGKGKGKGNSGQAKKNTSKNAGKGKGNR